MKKDLAAAWFAYPAVALASLVIAFVILQGWRSDLRVPFRYQTEALFNAMIVKATLEAGWPLDVPALAAPGRLDLRDLPLGDNNRHFAVIWLLGVVSRRYAVVMNLFFLSTFPLTAMSALYVFRRFGLAVGPALFGSLLYAFVPFHLLRGQYHLFLAAYDVVPLAVMVTLWIASGAVALVDARDGWWRWRRCRPKLIGSAIVCAFLASSGTYYAFYACFFMLTAGGLAMLRSRDVRHLALPLGLIVLTVAGLAANYGPSIRRLHQHGATRLVLRSPVDAEVYGLKMWQLLMPVTGHRVTRLAQFKDHVNLGRTLNENDAASLGVIGSLGFLTLLAWLMLAARAGDGQPGLLRDLSILNVSAVLLATVGGLGALVALLAPQIRAYNRISIYIAFFALFAVVAGLDGFSRRHCQTPGRRAAFALCLGVLLVAGVYDQSSARVIPGYEAHAVEFRQDAVFFKSLRGALGRDAMVFQLPVVPFPEHPPIHRMQDYDHLRGYLHVSDLRWSYGAMRGREGEAWQAWVAARPVPDLVDTLATAGFSALTVDRHAYADGGATLTAELREALGAPPVSYDHPRLLVFDLRPRQAALRARVTPAEWDARQDAALHPVLMIWEHGCFDLERVASGSYRWCSASGEWRLVNGGRRTRRVTLSLLLTSNPGTVWLDGASLRAELRTGPIGRPLSQTLSVPPGRHAIPFRSDAPPVVAAGDWRELVFRVHEFAIVPADQ